MEMVTFFNKAANKFIKIPATELAPGAVCAKIDGHEEKVWFIADDINVDGVTQHPPFKKSVRRIICKIQRVFQEVYPQSLEQWERNFRCERNCHREIAVWCHAADVYRDATNGEPSPNRRLEVFRCIASCLVSTPSTVWRVFTAEYLSRSEAQEVIDRIYGKWMAT